jgi:hypothetical protein
MLESKIEAAVCEYAKTKGFLVYKFTSPNRAAVPDRLFITPSGTTWFCEFKATGKKPTPQQEREHTRLRGNNAAVHVVDNIEMGIQIIDNWFNHQ